MVAADLTAAAEAVELARRVVDAGTDLQGRRRARRRPGARLRPRPRRRRRRDGPVDARLRRPRRARGRRSPAPSWPTPSASWPASSSAGRPPGASRPAPSTAPAPSAPPTATRRSSPSLAGQEGSRHLDDDFELVQDTFRRFADEKLKPIAEHIHRHNDDIPEDIISGLGEMGAFGLSIPEEYGGYGSGGESEYIGMVVATEELSRGSLGAGGSLITRPEILARALVTGGTEEQKHEWLPQLATAEILNAIAVTEPDVGQRLGHRHHQRHPHRRRLAHQRREDLVHLRRPGRRALLLARTDPDRSLRPPGPLAVHRPEGARRRPRLRAHPGRRREDGGPRRSTPSATAACTPTRSPSTVVRRRTPTSSAARTGSGGASTSRWPASRTAGSRPPPAPSA